MKKFNAKNFIKYCLTAVMLIVSAVILSIMILMLSVVPRDASLSALLIGNIKTVVLNGLPLLILMAILYFATGRAWIGFLSTSVVAFIIAEVNFYKISFRDDPFVFSDILLIGEATEMTGEYKLFWDIPSLVVLGVIALITVALVFFAKGHPRGVILRISGAVVGAITLVAICNSFYLHNNKIYNSMWHNEFGNQWKDANQYMSRGVIYSFIRSVRDSTATAPEGYDETIAEDILNQYQDSNIPKKKRVHTISIMLEAYNDFSEFDGIEFKTDPYKNFHELQKDSYSGKLYTNIFSAGTIDTERAFLTGYGDTSLKKKKTSSHVQYFKDQGYFTQAMHPGYAWFYDRKNIDSYIGFESLKFYEDSYKDVDEDSLKSNLYYGMLSDIDFFDSIIGEFENAVSEGKKYFNFSVTYQNHGPYDAKNHSTVDYAAKKDSYTDEGYAIFNNYLSGIYKTDLALKSLRDYVDNSEEPIVLILFGDHNPWLGDNNSVYDMLGINLDLDTAEGGQNYYQTPYVIYANKAAKTELGKEMVGEGDTISPMFLMQEYFEVAGLKGSQYIKYLSDLRDSYDVINKVYVGKDNEYILKKDDADSEVLKHHRFVEYYMKK